MAKIQAGQCIRLVVYMSNVDSSDSFLSIYFVMCDPPDAYTCPFFFCQILFTMGSTDLDSLGLSLVCAILSPEWVWHA